MNTKTKILATLALWLTIAVTSAWADNGVRVINEVDTVWNFGYEGINLYSRPIHRIDIAYPSKDLAGNRQQGIGSYVLDFYCPDRRLCVELDGSSHDYRYEYDEARTQFLAEQGIRVVRFRNDQVFTCLSGVVEEIVKAAGEITDPTPTPPLQGRGVPTVTPPRKCRVQEGSAYGHPSP
jgi:hypothetical protein